MSPRSTLLRSPLGIAFAALALTGCSLSFDGGTAPEQQNACSSSVPCGGDGICLSNTCVATQVDLAGLVLEVRPHSDAVYGASTSFFFEPGDQLGLEGSADRG